MAQPTDVPKDHWAYAAIESLSAKGLVLGYPDGKFVGNRAITRYEMATIISRVLDNVDKSIDAAKSGMASAPAAPAPAPAASSTPSVSPEDLATISKLVDEFKTELAVIGADVAGFKERMDKQDEKIDELQNNVDVIKSGIEDPEGSIQTTISDVKKLNKVKVSGYLQARYTYDFNPANITGNTTTVLNNAATASAKAQQGFGVRRGRLKVDARPTDNTGISYQIDFGGGQTSIATGTPANIYQVVTKDANIQYYLKGDPGIGGTFVLGQFLTPFGYQLVRSSSVRETPEFSEVITRLFNDSSTLDIEYDRGLKYSSPTEQALTYELGVMNGAGPNQYDNNQARNTVGKIRLAVADNIDLGVSGYWGQEPDGAKVLQSINRYGADLEIYFGNWNLKGEYVTAQDVDYRAAGGTATKWGMWGQVTRNFGAMDQFVAMYDSYNNGYNYSGSDAGPGTDTWNVGWIHYMDSATKLKFFYKMPDNNRFNTAIFEVVSIF
jgi:hypothetical protein